MAKVLLSLGTNLGERRHNLSLAIESLDLIMTVKEVSPVYETPPWGPVQDQPAFLNICLGGQTDLAPLALLAGVKRIEERLGREPSVRWGPRLIDIDILFFDQVIIDEAKLTIPHPHLTERAFVLAPLADIAPEFWHPQQQKTVAELWQELAAADEIVRLPEPLDPPAGFTTKED